MDTKPGFRYGFIAVLFVIIMAGQYLSVSYLQSRFNARLQECYEAVNQTTLLLTAVINRLEKKNLLTRADVIAEAETLSADLKALMRKIEAEKNQQDATPAPVAK